MFYMVTLQQLHDQCSPTDKLKVKWECVVWEEFVPFDPTPANKLASTERMLMVLKFKQPTSFSWPTDAFSQSSLGLSADTNDHSNGAQELTKEKDVSVAKVLQTSPAKGTSLTFTNLTMYDHVIDTDTEVDTVD